MKKIKTKTHKTKLILALATSLVLIGCDDSKSSSIPAPSSSSSAERMGQKYQESRPYDDARGFNKVDANSPILEAVGLPALDAATANTAYQITAYAARNCSVSKNSAQSMRSAKNKANWGLKEGTTAEMLSIETNLRDLDKRHAQWNNTVISISAKHKMDPNIIHAIISVESAYVPTAGSNKGAMGMMQLLRGTGKENGLYTDADFFNGTKNIDGGTSYFKKVLKIFKAICLLRLHLITQALAPLCGVVIISLLLKKRAIM